MNDEMTTLMRGKHLIAARCLHASVRELFTSEDTPGLY